ncbi:MAG: hypothetical protein LBU83_03935 [Bacteroidales bacterium]|nr:hypothetical protein [Bacteroidales bacterium]
MKPLPLLLLLLFAFTFKGFAQEKTIEIQPQKESFNSVTLIPICGKGAETEVPFTVFWDKKTETVEVCFKSSKVGDKVLFCFPKKLSIKKNMKLRKDIWFAKEVKKCQRKKTVNPCVDLQNLVNIEAPMLDSITALDLADKKASIVFLFKKPFQDAEDIVIPFHLYLSSKDTLKKERTRKIEYEALFTLVIKKKTESSAPQPPKEAVNCKTLYKANEQLAELLLDIKNSSQANLPTLKKKYEAIKKSVANPEYKNCKEEYKAFVNLCNKIDNRLK